MKKTMKIVSILMMAIMMLMVATPVFAAKEGETTSTDIQIKPTPPTDTGGILQIAGKVLGFLQWIALVGGVIIIAVLGVKYMMGSLEEKAEYKKTFVPFIVGAIVIFAAPQIAKLIFNIVK